jgi:hypothetical protein
VRVVDAPVLDAEAQRMYSEAIQKLKVKGAVTTDAIVIPATPAEVGVKCQECQTLTDHSKVPTTMGTVRCSGCKHVIDQEGKVADLWEDSIEDKGLDNFMASPASEGGHSHRVRLDPATGNGFSDYVLGHSHDIVNKVVQQSLSVVSGTPAETPHTHPMGKKIAPIDSTDKCVECEGLVFSDSEMAEIATLVTSGEDADATLTAKQRKDMSAGTFCGPARSYPVNDCSHGANAKARATQQVKAGKLSAGAAAKIKACANRKMKSLGCGGSDGLTTGNDVVDALIELVNDLRFSYEADLTSLKATGKTKEDSQAAMKVTLDSANDAHRRDLEQIASLQATIKEEKAKNVLALSLMLKKDSFLNTFSGKDATERAESYKNKVKSFGSIPLQDITIKEEELFTELTKQAIVQSTMDSIDPVLAGKIRVEQNKNQRLTSWIRSDQA